MNQAGQMEKESTILVVEDDRNIVKFLVLSLSAAGYKTIIAGSGTEAISQFMLHNPDLIFLDLGLPDMDGMEVLTLIRAKSDVPVIVISARGRERDKVAALDGGADDYVTKPFAMGELLARARVGLRKRQPKTEVKETFRLPGFELDYKKRRASVDDVEIHLTPIEYKLLCLLTEHAGQVLTHSYIIEHIWGYGEDTADSQSLRVFMANLRRKIEKDSTIPRYILTEMGVGYRFSDS